MKVILLDDEKSMLLIMKKMLSKIPGVEITGSFQSSGEAYGFLKGNKPDIAFVDINMPVESGIEFARKIAAEYDDIFIVFLTAHKEYALEAFDVNASDYIVKPITQERLEISIKRAGKRLNSKNHSRDGQDPARLFVYCLGTMEVRSAEGSVVQFTSSKSLELLAYLLLKRGRSISKWSVIEDIFPGMPLQNAETYLNTTVYKLRKVLESHGIKSMIVSANESYRADLRDVYVDFIDFENRIAEFSEPDKSNPEEALKTEKLFCGELFGDKDYDWSLPDRERLTEIYWSFAKRLSDFLIEYNQLTWALQILRKLIQMDELDEEINCLFFKVYAAQNDKVSLKRQYEQYEKALRSELGVAPENTAVCLYSKLLDSMK